MNRRFIVMLFLGVLILAGLSREAQALCTIRKGGKTVATLEGITFRKGGKDLGTFDGVYIKKKGAVVGRYDGVYLKKKNIAIGYVDGYQVKKADGTVLYVVTDEGRVKKNGKLYMSFNDYSGIFDVKYLMAVYLLFFDR
ncbi:MAG: hypothetical protein RDV48_23290 [Candidatus Eremiobacteraeota bacterium]|nr:hypothetical protein [Candidatus Eremiobacteraeota bacterium]